MPLDTQRINLYSEYYVPSSTTGFQISSAILYSHLFNYLYKLTKYIFK